MQHICACREYACCFRSCQVLVTKQTGPAGKPVNTLYIAKKMKLANEMYFAILLDRATAGPIIIACSEGALQALWAGCAPTPQTLAGRWRVACVLLASMLAPACGEDSAGACAWGVAGL